MTMHKALHPGDDVDRQYVSRKEGGRGYASIQCSINTTTRRLHKKAQRKTDYSDKGQYRQNKNQ